MSIPYPLKQRTDFIRQFYAAASSSYVLRIRQIEEQTEPWIPFQTDDGEPPFLAEWLEADESLKVLGGTCISMLAATLKLYFEYLIHVYGIPKEPSDFGQKETFAVYRNYFNRLGIDFERSPSDLSLLRELTLARNSFQHPVSIYSVNSCYSDKDLTKIRHPFFVDARERELLSNDQTGLGEWLMPPTINVTATKLEDALVAVEIFGEWLASGEVSERSI